jgi:hypothetical protein
MLIEKYRPLMTTAKWQSSNSTTLYEQSTITALFKETCITQNNSIGNNLSVAFQMFADGNGFLDKEVKVLGNLRRQSLCLQNTQDFVSRHKTNLSHSM